jgi:hypothetical protein
MRNELPVDSCLKGRSNEIFASDFSGMDSSLALYFVSEDFLKLTANSRRYLQFLIDSLLSFIAQSRCSPYCLIQRVVTPRIVCSGESQMYVMCRNSGPPFNTRSWGSSDCLKWRVTAPRIIVARSQCWQWRVIFTNFKGLPLPAW